MSYYSGGNIPDDCEVAQSLDHLPSSSAAPAASSDMQRHNSTSDVLSASPSSYNKPLGTLQRLARSSTNLISRSKSCLTIESLQRFRKNLSRVERNASKNCSANGKVPISSSNDELSPQVSDKPLLHKNNSQSSSLISVDFENDNSDQVTERLSSPIEEAITSSSNLSLSSSSKIEPFRLDKETVNNIVQQNGDASFCNGNMHTVSPNNISNRFSTKGLQTSKSASSIAQRSNSFHIDPQKKSITRNPSMLYYFKKTPLLKFRKEDRNNITESLDSVQLQNSLNASGSGAKLHVSIEGESNETSLLTNYSSGGELIIDPPAVFAREIHQSVSADIALLNSSVTKTNEDLPQYMPHRITNMPENCTEGDHHIIDPSQFHGPEFVIRSREPPKHLALGSSKYSSVSNSKFLFLNFPYVAKINLFSLSCKTAMT